MELCFAMNNAEPTRLFSQVFAIMIRAEKKELYKTVRGNPVKVRILM